MREDEAAIRTLVDTWLAASRAGDLPTVRRAGHTLTILRKGLAGAWMIARDANLL